MIRALLLSTLLMPLAAHAQVPAGGCTRAPSYFGCYSPVSPSRGNTVALVTPAGPRTASIADILGQIQTGDLAALGAGKLSLGPFANFGGWSTTQVTAQTDRLSLPGVLNVSRATAGQGDNAVAVAVIANSVHGSSAEAGVLGYVPGLGAAFYPDIDSVALYTENTGRDPLFIASGVTFSVSGSVARVVLPTPLTTQQVARLFRGMQILTNHTNPWVAWIDSWDPAGAWVQVIGGFTHFAGSTATGQDPTGSAVTGPVQVAFAPITKIWGQNTNCFIGRDPDGNTLGAYSARKCTGSEVGVFNGLAYPHTWKGDYDPTNSYSWGYDAASLGASRASAAFIARGGWDVAFQARSGNTAAFMVDGEHASGLNGPGFLSTQTSGSPFEFRPGGVSSAVAFSLSPVGSIEIGKQDTAQDVFIDFHSAGVPARDYDARILSTGGSPTVNGQGLLIVYSAAVVLANCPASATSLPSGALWCDGSNIVHRVP